jgi:GTP:adenosylcobinamide-phosphate guanylyltransferase
MDAIVTAGGIPQPGEPLYEYTQGICKALLDIAGKPMIQWVLDALEGSQAVERIVVIGLPESSGIGGGKIADFIPNQGGMVDNIRAGVVRVLDLNPQAHHVLLVSSDIPAITTEMVDWMIKTTMQTDEDVYYSVIERKVMEKRFPASKRSYTHLKDLEVCGGDMNMIRSSLITSNSELWERIINARKNVFKQAALIGFDTLILLLLRLITLESGVKMVTKRLKVTGRAIVCPYAEVGMDIDKPHQLDIIRTDLARKVMA